MRTKPEAIHLTSIMAFLDQLGIKYESDTLPVRPDNEERFFVSILDPQSSDASFDFYFDADGNYLFIAFDIPYAC